MERVNVFKKKWKEARQKFARDMEKNEKLNAIAEKKWQEKEKENEPDYEKYRTKDGYKEPENVSHKFEYKDETFGKGLESMGGF